VLLTPEPELMPESKNREEEEEDHWPQDGSEKEHEDFGIHSSCLFLTVLKEITKTTTKTKYLPISRFAVTLSNR
jgi:hypothetical protein